MKRNILFFCLTISLVFSGFKSLNAQMWFSPGSTWYYSYNNFWAEGYVKIETVSDTIIENRTCFRLNKELFIYNYLNSTYDTINIGSEYMYSNNDSVMIYKHNKFYVLYNFAAQPGQSWCIPETYESPCDSIGYLTVIGTGDTLICSQELRYIIVNTTENSHWAINGLIIEKIGPLEWYMLPEQTCIADLFEGGYFRCYEDQFFQFNSQIVPYCDYITNIEQHINNDFVVYPNPVSNELKIKLVMNDKDYQLQIINIFGRLVKKYMIHKNEETIVVNDIEHGIYFIVLSDSEDKTTVQKIIIN